MPEHPRRRAADGDRRRWNDQALDGLRERVVSVEDQAHALHELQIQAARRDERLGHVCEAVDKLEGTVERLGDTVENVRDEIRSRFDRVDLAHETGGASAAVTHGADWRTVLAIAGTVVVPIVVAIITTSGG